MNWEKLCLKLSFTIENKMGNLLKEKDGVILNLTLIIEIFHFLRF